MKNEETEKFGFVRFNQLVYRWACKVACKRACKINSKGFTATKTANLQVRRLAGNWLAEEVGFEPTDRF